MSAYRVVSSRSAMAAGDKQHPVSVKKVALRELSNESKNIITKAPGSSPLPKDKGFTPDSVKGAGTKRMRPDGPSSPSTGQAAGNSVTQGPLVYVRRKLETDHGKIGTGVSADNAGSPDSRKSSNDRTEEPIVQQNRTQEPKAASFSVHMPLPVATMATSSGVLPLPHSLGKPVTGLPVPEPQDSTVTTGVPLLSDPQRPVTPDWKERFVRLQMFLKSCDQSNQEDYIRMLRSLSAVGRSRHAVELEKRAIHLLLEEGKELHRMKVLNVLGKTSLKDDM